MPSILGINSANGQLAENSLLSTTRKAQAEKKKLENEAKKTAAAAKKTARADGS